MNEFYSTILALGSFFGALTVILAFLHKLKSLNKIRDWFNKPVSESLLEIRTRLNELDNRMLKLTICSEEIPIEERLIAGEIYTEERNLNGEVKAKYKVLKESYENELRKHKED